MTKKKKQARLITLEGIDGVGKTTHVTRVVGLLANAGLAVATYREPGTTQLGEELRGLIKHGLAKSALAELMLFAAARAELVATYVNPDLESGTFVVLDRFTDSTLAYQGALGRIEEDVLVEVCTAATGGLTPDLTIWLDLEPGEAFKRLYPLAGRLAGQSGAVDTELDVIEQRSTGYFKRVRDRYRALLDADPRRMHRVDASGEVEETAEKIKQIVYRHLEDWGVLEKPVKKKRGNK